MHCHTLLLVIFSREMTLVKGYQLDVYDIGGIVLLALELDTTRQRGAAGGGLMFCGMVWQAGRNVLPVKMAQIMIR